jgi:predicted dehydrogenase
MGTKPLTAAIVGAGHRSMVYADYSTSNPDKLKIVALADPNPLRREWLGERYNIPEEMRFQDADALAAQGKIADCIINGTMDEQHVPTCLPLLELGYDILLEKPFATHEKEMWELVHAARKHNRKMMICHVLRYAPFYSAIRKRLIEGAIGQVMNVQTTEHVSYHHMATAFIRGKWGSEKKCNSTMLLAKCCHDLDLIMWMKSGVAPKKVSSFGSLMYFRPDRAPEGAGKRCLVDCKIEETCPFSAKKIYIDSERWGFYAWDTIEHIKDPTVEDKLESLRGDNPHGRCVWHCDNDVVDHQSVIIEFADGSTASHNLVGGTSRPMRSIHLLGTEGEIWGDMETSKFVVRRPNPTKGNEYFEEEVDVKVTGDMHGGQGGHGGGDERLVADFVSMMNGQEPSISCTTIEDSVHGHQVVYAADESRLTSAVVDLELHEQIADASK